MANPVQKRGLELIYSAGEPIIVNAIVPASDGTVLGLNDPVAITALDASGLITVTRVAAGGNNTDGVIMNPKVFPYNYMDTDMRRAASVLSTVSVMLCQVGDGKIFRIQASASSTTFAVANFATTKYCDYYTIGDADSATGISTVEVACGTVASADGDLYVLGVDSTYGNTNDIGANVKLQVRIANLA